MFEQLCGCSTKMLSPEDATYVFHGVPYCRRSCMEGAEARFQLHQRALRDLSARQEATRGITRIVQEDGHFHVI